MTKIGRSEDRENLKIDRSEEIGEATTDGSQGCKPWDQSLINSAFTASH